MHRRLLILILVALSPGMARGQTAAAPDQTEVVKALLERVEQLEKRVSELEAARTAAPVQSAAPAATTGNVVLAKYSIGAPAPKAQDAPDKTAQMHEHEQVAAVAQQAEIHYPSLQIRGFGDVDFSATDQHGAASNSGFNLGQFDLHFASALSQKVSFFAETTFTAQPTGYNTEVERSIIRYDYNDYFKVSFGRYHTPVGYWNTAYHHGAWLQTTINRPDIVRIGSTFIPIHFVGLLAEGAIPSGGAGLNYSFGVGNGRGNIISRAGDAGDNNDNRAWVANIFARPVRLYGLQLGASVYRDKIHLADGRDFREWISGAHLVWTKESPEFLAEFDNVNHRQVGTDLVTNSQAFYVQVGYRLPWFEKQLKPYYRFEYTHTPRSEQVFGNQDLVGSTFGLRYDITNYAAFKGEYRHTERQPGTPTVNGAFFQTAFTF
jgi:hypothetical protein